MAKSRAQKEALLQEYKELLSSKGGFLVVDTAGIDAATVTELKLELKDNGANLSVIKNNVFKIALEEADFPVESKDFDSQTAILSYDEDPTVVAKKLKEVQQDNEGLLDAKYAVIAGKYLSGEKVMELADIPSKEVLLAKMLGSLNAPLSGLASVLTGNVRGFVQATKQLSEKGAESN